MTMKFEVLKRRILRPTFSIDIVQQVLRWERQQRCSSRKRLVPMVEKCGDNKFNELFIGEETMKTREDKSMVKLDLFSK